MSTTISEWILDFLLRKPITNIYLMNTLFYVLPVSNVSQSLWKPLLLRRIFLEIESLSVSESILNSIEMIEELGNREKRVSVMGSMREAYNAVAVECTVKVLRENPEDLKGYLDAYVTIWRGRVEDMENRKGVGEGLVSERLMESKVEIEAALLDVNARMNLLMRDTRSDALNLVRVFLDEASKEMGPSFLERVADNWKPSSDAPKEKVNVIVEDNTREVHEVERIKPSSFDVPRDNLDVIKRSVVLEDTTRKVLEALKSSCSDLREVVKDPLPDALCMAASISASLKRAEIKLGRENQNAVDMDACEPCIDKGVETVHAKETSNQNEDHISRPSLMTRNPTACTFEWGDDSIESSNGGSPSHPRLPTRRRLNVSPLERPVRRGNTRRRQKRWSSEEEQTLRDAVREYGRGNWKLILDNCHDKFEERTLCDLKDKWRNMMR
ncbi:hypothetical protein GIB67_027666 [Kingdonia uniflora]|uniref:Uncharacterized protein n=1 Tax=Kingdonia uniflora TaxID=39325 RepID=A0A7J7NLR3_9MAGN|nr:hypothetical protein GIB67_027666 [Kingdonia uniflora]